MHEIIENKIGYDRIRGQVEAKCTTQGGIAKFRDERFVRNKAEIQSRLRLAGQMKYVLGMVAGFPAGEYADLTPVLKKASVEGAFLDTQDLVVMRGGLGIVGDLVRFFAAGEDENYPDLRTMSAGVDPCDAIRNHIDTITDRYGNVRDSASAELYAIRKELSGMQGQVSKRLQRIMAEARGAGLVDPDAAVSIRDGRAVIPVSAANKRKLSGFVHDESATGKTVYIEPAEIVEMNNHMRELEHRERREIVRILTEFTDSLRPWIDRLETASDYLTTIDMIRAKARWAAENGCTVPIVSDDGILELRQARHPLLQQALRKDGREIVPLDLRLTPAHRLLVISGPNAGGKSVALKTVGLLQWMFQCGMPVPLLDNSQFPVFDGLFLDIGDEQSIDNDLSTYSSHLTNMKQMLHKATDRSLILIDEFGTGTEPVIGGAIAEAILARLNEKGCYGVITTHYSNLKYYAANTEGIVNGAMTFDVQNIRPLFSLEMGTPGSSFAIEIARKIGLPEELIASASEKAGTDHVSIERQLRQIARDKRYWEQKRDRIRITDRRVEELERKYAEQLAVIRSQRAEILKQARAEAEKITAEANRQIETAIKTIRESQADKEKTRIVRRNLDNFRDSLEHHADTADAERMDREMEKILERRRRREEKRGQKPANEPSPQEEQLPGVPVVGSKVRIDEQQTVGEVQSIKGKKATVAVGQLLTTVDVGRLSVVSNSEFKKQTRQVRPVTVKVSEDVSRRKLNFKHSIDVRGMRASEALDAVEDFIDDAVMVGASEVRILHGKGTGALKEEIRRWLKAGGLVRSLEDEHVDAGGAGITVVKL